ncbi:hypothetical protein CYLTODRAFT_268675 [Cylindrobasidium torrendii FP15055 ss-10]|uniref:Uncharacterized protein n=1 Tax=Cylindrobasidium torrendii FP15055 ss-10 TaxID=1314674 RepID=A0A0D7BRF0_9AGAR|nr:hypothetical protein CYLTODRAFT_268675 [Cylindrobasidium torrendii FP15055 ss-10]
MRTCPQISLSLPSPSPPSLSCPSCPFSLSCPSSLSFPSCPSPCCPSPCCPSSPWICPPSFSRWQLGCLRRKSRACASSSRRLDSLRQGPRRRPLLVLLLLFWPPSPCVFVPSLPPCPRRLLLASQPPRLQHPPWDLSYPSSSCRPRYLCSCPFCPFSPSSSLTFRQLQRPEGAYKFLRLVIGCL